MRNRQQQERTDESITDSIRRRLIDIWKAGTPSMSNTEMSTPEHILGRMLSMKNAIPRDSALAEVKKQRAQDDKFSIMFRSIGAGQCGVIYALRGTTTVIKLPQSPEKSDELFVDYHSHLAVQEAFRSVSVIYRVHIRVPPVRLWVNAQSEHFWATLKAFFGKDVQVPNYGLVSERINPVPLAVRSALVDVFAPKAVRERKHEFLMLQKNRDCLIRLYLGRRNDDAPPVAADRFHLRNFPLHINEMERLKLDTTYYAELMAQTLAIMHWRAGLDANDVEFAFGSSPEYSEQPLAEDVRHVDKDEAAMFSHCDFFHCTISVWLLDFNQCKSFTKDKDGLKQLVDAFYWNDPYYPRPTNPKDKDLWRAFAKHYLAVSAEFTNSTMPQEFITSVEERAQKRSANSLLVE